MATLEQDILTRRDMPEDGLDDVTRRGLAIYNAHLKAQLEPTHNGEVVAIHLDSGDFAVAPSSGNAMRTLRVRRPQGLLLMHTIGPATDLGLVTRMLGRRLFAPGNSETS